MTAPRSRRWDVALSLIERLGEPRRPQAVAHPPAEKEYAMDSLRLTLTSPRAGSSLSHTLQVPVDGRLAGITVFVDTPDGGDRISLTLRDRAIIDRLHVDLGNRTSYEKRLDERIRKGDLLTLSYFSAGTTSKNVTWTPEIVQKVE